MSQNSRTTKKTGSRGCLWCLQSDLRIIQHVPTPVFAWGRLAEAAAVLGLWEVGD